MTKLIQIDTRFVAGIEDLKVTSEVEGLESMQALYATSDKLWNKFPDFKLTEARFLYCIENMKISDLDFEVLESFLESKGCSLEHYQNERMGIYDQHVNRVSPIDMGTVFPDLTVRIYWNESDANIGVEELNAFMDAVLVSFDDNVLDEDYIFDNQDEAYSGRVCLVKTVFEKEMLNLKNNLEFNTSVNFNRPEDLIL